jgi:NAD+ synthase
MKLESSLFIIDAPDYIERLCEFIQVTMSGMHRQGILVPLSGGLDSSTVLLLCARAAGVENITALLLPERQGNPEAIKYAHLVIDRFHIKSIRRDISPILSALGTYKFILSLIPFRSLQERVVRKYFSPVSENPFLQIVLGRVGDFERKGFSKFNTKQRVRLVVAYQIAEERNLMVVGSAHKSEDMLGLYVKFGVDDVADVMPLKNLYRSQIIQLAAHLGVPDEILERTPNPDIIPGVSDKYMDLLGLPSRTLDLLVYGIEHGLEDADIASQLDLPLVKVSQIRTIVRSTEHMRSPSLSLTWD